MRTGIYINFAYQEASILIIRLAELYILKRIKDMLLPILMLLNAPLSCHGFNKFESRLQLWSGGLSLSNQSLRYKAVLLYKLTFLVQRVLKIRFLRASGNMAPKQLQLISPCSAKTPMLLRSNLKMHKNGRLTSEMFPADQQGKVVEYVFLRGFFLTLNQEMLDVMYIIINNTLQRVQNSVVVWSKVRLLQHMVQWLSLGSRKDN